ncbi:MAG: class I tRNA ligase family protein [Bacteroidetes bacterium]|nr:class I tRNA ligase family protein [Bacteroidota bacterium]
MIQGVSAFTQIWAPFIWVKPLGKTVLPKFNSKTVFIISKQKAERFLNGDEQVRAQMLHIYDLVFLKKQSSEWSSLIRNVHYELIYDANNFENSILFRHVDIKFILEKDELNTEEYTKWRSSWPSLQGINEVLEYILEEDGKYICSREVEKMSKSKYNVVTPDSICDSYGADTLRMYEMFLGPLEQSKPWNTNGITGVHGFLKRFWRMFYEENRQDEIQNSKFKVQNSDPTEAELKVLHRTLKKIREDIERYSFNTCVSQFMICVNELMELKCSKRGILEPLVIALSPFAPHIAEELWEQLGNKTSVTIAAFPKIDEKYLVDDSFNYPVQINGKVRFNFSISLALAPAEIEKEILSSEEAKKWLEGKTPKKVIVVPKRIVNIVL